MGYVIDSELLGRLPRIILTLLEGVLGSGLLQRVAGEVAQGSFYTLGGSPREWALAAMSWRVKVERFDVDSPGSLSVKWAASGVT